MPWLVLKPVFIALLVLAFIAWELWSLRQARSDREVGSRPRRRNDEPDIGER